MTRRQVLSAGCLAASLLALPGCGRRAPGNNGKRVGIVLTEGLAGLALQELATAQGFFREFDIEPQVLLVSDGSKCVAALVSGASQICLCSGFNQVTPAIAKGAPLKILGGGLTLSSLAMYSSRPDIQRVADLAGKVIGIGAPGSVLQQMTVLLLRKKGMVPNSVQFRNVGSTADILKAVTAKTVDAGLLLSDAQIDLVQQVNVEFRAQASVLPVPQIADMSLARDALKLLV